MEGGAAQLHTSVVSTLGPPDADESPSRWIASPPAAEWTPTLSPDAIRDATLPPAGSLISFASFSGRGLSGPSHHDVPAWVVQWPVVHQHDLTARGIAFPVQRHFVYLDAGMTLVAARLARLP